MFTAAVLTKADLVPTQMPINDGLNKENIYTLEYYAAIKKDEFVSFVGTWKNLETIILSKLRNRKPNTVCSHS